MALKKANAEIIRMNLKTNVVTKRKKDGNFFYAKERNEILEVNPLVSNLNVFSFNFLIDSWKSLKLQDLQSAIVLVDWAPKEIEQRS